MATEQSIGWLWQIVDTGRAVMKSPWTYQWNGEPWTVATNGRVVAMTRGAFGFDPASDLFDNLMKSFPVSAPLAFPLDEACTLAMPWLDTSALPPCDLCRNTGAICCNECEGEGDVDCSCKACGDDHERSCDKCNGVGSVACSCGRKQPSESRPCTIGIARFDLNLLALVLPYIGDGPATWQQDKINTVALLRTPMWTIGIMPMARKENDTPRYALELGAAPSDHREGQP